MATLTPARKVAYQVFFECRRNNLRVRDYLRESKDFSELSAQDKAFATRLALGATLTKGKLDEALKNHLKSGIHLEPRVQDALRIAVFEVLYLETRRDAAISQGVELVKSVSRRSSGLANAVLRKISEHEANLARAKDPHTPSELSWASGIPEWICLEIIESLGKSAAQRLILNLKNPAPVYVLQRNLSEQRLRNGSLELQKTFLPDVYEVKNPAQLNVDAYVKKVQLVPADLASQLVAFLAASYVHQNILEIGQGRGTKSLLLSHAFEVLDKKNTHITAVELLKGKSHISKRRMKVAGLRDQVTSLMFDATQFASPEIPEELNQSFEVVFIDAPCSGLGTLRRHPEIAWNLSANSLYDGGELTVIQTKLLRSCSSRVEVGGYLIYATCSLSNSENQQVVEDFLASSEGFDFEVQDLHECPARTNLIPEAQEFLDTCITPEGFLQTAFASADCDAHFMAVFKRK
ncbi:RsmB/NOP family class I SAM-dependent RNA methyltransferase [Lancefieldella parvula]|uniref:RsmB/NOP family class I SAM-dependent RNA methyltransferase n=1 Tax=Lancefieldella parvula TaxID=1382 RepID=UPI00360B6907